MSDTKKNAKPVLRVTPEQYAAVKALADAQGLQLTDAATQVLTAGLVAVQSGKPDLAPSGASELLSPETLAKVQHFAKHNEMTPTKAADRLVTVAIGRLKALADYGRAQQAAPRRVR